MARRSTKRRRRRPAYIPEDAEWYLAWLVVMIEHESHRRPLVWVNEVLIRARSPEEAYQRALQKGREANSRFRNRGGSTIRHRFLGLRDLNVIHEKLEHGAELSYEEHRKASAASARALVQPKQALAVFRPRGPGRPDYLSADIHRRLDEDLGPGWR